MKNLPYIIGALVVTAGTIALAASNDYVYKPITVAAATPAPVVTPSLETPAAILPTGSQPRATLRPLPSLAPQPVYLGTFTPPVLSLTPASTPPAGVVCHQVFVPSTTSLGDYQTVCD